MMRLLLPLGLFIIFKRDLIEKGIYFVNDKLNGYPIVYDSLFQKYGAKHSVDWKILKRIAVIESNLGRAKSVAHGLKNPNDVEASKSSDGKSWGIMQVTLKTAQWLDPQATVAKLNNPEYSIDLAAKYLKFLFDFFPQVDSRRIEWVVKSYNQGQGNSANERAGKSQGFAHAYWEKYLKLTSEV